MSRDGYRFKSFNTLPDKYQLDYQIDMLKDKKELFLVNVYSLLILVLVIVVYYLILRFTDKSLAFSFNNDMLVNNNLIIRTIILIASLFLYIVVHEIIHAIFFKLATKEKVKFGFHGIMASACVPGVYFYKKPYLLAGLAPAIIMSVVFIAPMFFVNGLDLLFFFALFAVHISGCAGDFYIAIKLIKYPSNTLIEDTGTGMKFFTKNI